MKIAFTEKVISPKIGVRLAGYGPNDVSRALLDDLYLTMLCLESDGQRAALISFDLLGMNAEYSQTIRRETAEILGVPEASVMVSCTHTHCGPHLRTNRSVKTVETDYLDMLYRTVREAARELATADFREVNLYYYVKNCDFNCNRRIVSADNRCSYLPITKDLIKLADGICDKELGLLCFSDAKTGLPHYLIGNYAAHPLSGHGPGLGGLRISADYPGAFRNYVKEETGAGCMFLTGMAGNMVARGYEEGREAIRDMGVGLAREALDGYNGATRQPERFKLQNTTLHSRIEKGRFQVRKHRLADAPDGYVDADGTVELEVQLLSIGEICLIGVPCEVLTELGLEIKWHSPFRRTLLLYNSTGYFDYLGPANAVVSGGYEGDAQLFTSRSGLQLVQLAVDGAYKLFEETFEEKDFPDNQDLPLVAFRMK